MKRFMVLVSMVMFSLLLVACEASGPTQVNYDAEAQSGRMVVTSFQQVKLSDGDTRDILVLRDTETGREYLAVYGAGVFDITTECRLVGKVTVCKDADDW
ncbi:MAG: hypothetical protein PHN75_16950 [Syntrophales bacterium]|nr:hypothetical protein [Syntrophales bacterium]